MDNLDEVVLNSFDRYFTHLQYFGQSKNTDKNSMLITMFINQILKGPMSAFVTNEDYNIMQNVLFCLSGNSCTVDYQTFKMQTSMFDNKNTNFFIKQLEDSSASKLTEDNVIRFHLL